MGATYRILDSGRDRTAWLEARANSLGASEAAAVIGISRFASPLSVYTNKVMGAEPFDNDIMRFGRVYEQQILRDFSEATGRKVKKDGRLIFRAVRPWQSCTLDAWQWDEARGRGLLEAKTSLFGWDDSGIPEDYWCQIQHQFAVTGAAWGTAVMFNRTNCEMVWKDVEPDHEYIRMLTDAEEGFWFGNVMAGEPPEADGHQATTDALRRLYPVPEEGKTLGFPIAMLEKRDRRAFVVEQIAAFASEKAELDNVFKAELKDAEVGLFPDGSGFSYKANKHGVRSLRVKEAK